MICFLLMPRSKFYIIFSRIYDIDYYFFSVMHPLIAIIKVTGSRYP